MVDFEILHQHVPEGTAETHAYLNLNSRIPSREASSGLLKQEAGVPILLRVTFIPHLKKVK
jgi:hypothetical protein